MEKAYDRIMRVKNWESRRNMYIKDTYKKGVHKRVYEWVYERTLYMKRYMKFSRICMMGQLQPLELIMVRQVNFLLWWKPIGCSVLSSRLFRVVMNVYTSHIKSMCILLWDDIIHFDENRKIMIEPLSKTLGDRDKLRRAN